MPIINVKLIEDVFTPDQKREIIERLTDAMVSIEGENLRPVTWVVVEEVASGDMGVGGKPLSTEDVKALCVRRPGLGPERATARATSPRLAGEMRCLPDLTKALVSQGFRRSWLKPSGAHP